jgi:hypothetical protein
MVDEVGIEPTCPKATELKSVVYANSTIRPYKLAKAL